MASELILTCQACAHPNPRPLPYDMRKPDRCTHCREVFTSTYSVMWRDLKLYRQTKVGSALEAVANTAVGYVIALVAMNLIVWAYGFKVSPGENAIIVGWMTLLSVLRGYVLRRIWNSEFWKRMKR